MDENKTIIDEERNIYFTKRISKMGETLMISIPDKEKEFSYGDLVKITLIRKFLQEDEQDEKKEKEKEVVSNNK